ncbi:putative membrane protein YeaQ/YmgE (transglycosylase-associated protein family) [Sphingomonas sp. SORGH_AS802]|nr:putative membrane protein YeaQ/YmgE (transglycosylase-associated protein family) [Sphingomonas sp. SORGH_AS_0802]
MTMGFIVLLVVGGLIGWVASMIMRTDGQQGIFLNIVVGIVGAMLAGFLITPLIGGAPITSGVISIQSVVVSLLGAVVLLAIINFFRRGALR